MIWMAFFFFFGVDNKFGKFNQMGSKVPADKRFTENFGGRWEVFIL